MPKLILCCISFLSFLFTFSQTKAPYTLDDFYEYHPELSYEVDEIFNQLDDTTRVGQMIVQAAGIYGKPEKLMNKLIKGRQLGGILLLKGEKAEFTAMAKELDSLSIASGGLPFLYSSDAEPSLFNGKIKNTRPAPRTNRIVDEAACDSIATQISEDLKDIGIYHNFAPVLDMSADNAAIGNRTFGSDSARVVNMSTAFVRASQREGVAATVKHFPGHGLVKGDTHHNLVYIDGEMKEVPLYQPLIDAGAISIMIAHIAVQNNEYDTDGMPASCSRKIVTDLLKDKMNFRGIVVTDGMGMGAVSKIPQSSLMAVKAGCDMILMPLNEARLHADILTEMEKDKAFRRQVYISVKKLIRLKLCLGIIQPMTDGLER